MALIWVHTPSVGEYITATPLLKYLKEQNHKLLITYSSPRARDFMEKQTLGDVYIHLPIWGLVFGYSVRSLIKKFNPQALILVESDRYPSLSGVEISRKIVINARISGKSFKFLKTFRFLYGKLFENFDKILCKDEETRKKFIELGVSPARLKVCGNLKVVFNPTVKSADIFLKNQKEVLVAGSTHRGEEEIIFSAFGKVKKAFPQAVLVVAPRHIRRSKEVYKLAKEKFPNLKVSLRTEVKGYYDGDILIVDTLGELIHFYKLSTVSFVGGSLIPVGGHNLLEPAYFGKPVLFGPYVEKFADLVELLEALNLAFPVKGEKDFSETVIRLFKNPPPPKGDLKEISKRVLDCYTSELEQLLKDL